MSPKLDPLGNELYKQLLAKEERYQAFGAEITRISLAGIALLGFFVQYVRGKCVFNTEGIMLALLGLSALAFSFSVASALAHRYFSTKGFSQRVRQIQYQLREEDSTLPDDHKFELVKATSEAARNFNRSARFFFFSTASCGFGAALVVFAILLATWFDDQFSHRDCSKSANTGSIFSTFPEIAANGSSISFDASNFAPEALKAAIDSWSASAGSMTVRNAGALSVTERSHITRTFGSRVTFEF